MLLIKAELQTAIPVIPAKDLAASVAFYEKLGFVKVHDYGDYVIIRREGVEVHLFINDDPQLAEWTSFRVKVENIEALAFEFKNNGVACKIETRSWGTKDLALIDPTGVLVTFQE